MDLTYLHIIYTLLNVKLVFGNPSSLRSSHTKKSSEQMAELHALLTHMADATQKSIKLLENEANVPVCVRSNMLQNGKKASPKSFFDDMAVLERTLKFAAKTPQAFSRDQLLFKLSKDLHHGTEVAKKMSKHLKKSTITVKSDKAENFKLVSISCKGKRHGKKAQKLYTLFLKIYRSLYRSSVILLRTRLATHTQSK